MKIFFTNSLNGGHRMSYKIVLDVGGTQIKSAVLDENSNLVTFNSIPTPNNITDFILDEVIQIVEQYKELYHLDPVYVGISSTGVINRDTGTVVYSSPTIANFTGTNYKQALSHITPFVYVCNDVDAALLGELHTYQYAQQQIFCLTLGTGIGGAFYTSETGLYQGANSRANEIGYMLYRPDSETTYEQRAATSALQTQITHQYSSTDVDVKSLFLQAKQGDETASALLHTWGKDVAEGVAQIQLLYDPALILIGGGISAQGDQLLQYIVPYVSYFLPANYEHAPIQTTHALNNAALLGAGSLITL